MGWWVATSVARSMLVVALLLTLQTTATADPPLQFWRHSDFTFRTAGASAVCGFDVFVHIEGGGRATLFYDTNGTIQREVDSAPNLKVTIFAPSTGKSFTYAFAGALLTTYNDGGVVGSTGIAVATGIDQRYPGAGVNAGRTVWEVEVFEIDEAGIPITDFVSVISETGSDLNSSIAVARCNAVR